MKLNLPKHMNKETPARLKYEAIAALNYSGMKHLMRSPLHYMHYLNAPNVETKALRVGKMVHEAILQPDVFVKYKPEPEVDKRTKEGKEILAYWKESIKENEVVVSFDEYNFVMDIADSVSSSLESKGIKFEFAESVHAAQCSITGVDLKCCIDAISHDGIIYDIKTTEDGGSQAFYRTCLNYKYYIQSYLYRMISGCKRFIFVVVEKEPPYAVSYYELGEEFDNKAKQEIDKAIQLYKICKDTGVWNGYTDEIIKLDLPKKFI